MERLQIVVDMVAPRLELLNDREYHNMIHTLDVVKGVNELADKIGLPDEKREPLRVAAYYHDVVQDKGLQNEEKSAEVAGIDMKEIGYSDNDIDFVKNCIVKGTKLVKQKDGSWRSEPETLPQMILADADLRVFGQSDFMEKAEGLRSEWGLTGEEHEKEFLERQTKFLGGHKYHTQAAKQLWDEQKQKNLKALKLRLKELEK